jgi:acyl-CoA synthetase (AMP-forming)/AMP-acid ligase II
VQPEEIERILLQHTDVSEAKVYGKKSAVLGTILCCQIVCLGVTEKIIKDYLKHKLPLYKIPRIIELVTSIEYNANGKISRRDD